MNKSVDSSLTAEYLRTQLSYDPVTGEFRWLAKGPGRHKGVVGCIGRDGYRRIRLDSALYLAHRLAWLYVTGAWPKEFIDHADMAKDNNRFANLREATVTQNMGNRRAYKRNTSGFKGVEVFGSKWTAKIRRQGKSHHLGVFDNPEAASAAYEVAAKAYFGEFARTG